MILRRIRKAVALMIAHRRFPAGTLARTKAHRSIGNRFRKEPNAKEAQHADRSSHD